MSQSGSVVVPWYFLNDFVMLHCIIDIGKPINSMKNKQKLITHLTWIHDLNKILNILKKYQVNNGKTKDHFGLVFKIITYHKQLNQIYDNLNNIQNTIKIRQCGTVSSKIKKLYILDQMLINK